jgi:hypothetical protein
MSAREPEPSQPPASPRPPSPSAIPPHGAAASALAEQVSKLHSIQSGD